MGEGSGKPKLERGANQKKQPQQLWARKRASADKKFKAPTQGLEHMIFKKGDAADAAAFVEVKKALAKYAGVYFKVGSAMAQAAIDRLEEPDIKEPEDPKPMSSLPTIQEEKAREMWKYELEDYVKQTRAWKDAKGRAFQLVMSHVDPDLEEKLESASQWETINEHQDVVGLLKLIRAHAHQHDEVKQGVVSFVEMDLNIYLGYQPNGQDISTFYKLFKARCDVIDTFPSADLQGASEDTGSKAISARRRFCRDCRYLDGCREGRGHEVGL
jgi:hypothetical protein